jgi:hypothetical protein
MVRGWLFDIHRDDPHEAHRELVELRDRAEEFFAPTGAALDE